MNLKKSNQSETPKKKEKRTNQDKKHPENFFPPEKNKTIKPVDWGMGVVYIYIL